MLETHGPNEVEHERPVAWWRHLWISYNNPSTPRRNTPRTQPPCSPCSGYGQGSEASGGNLFGTLPGALQQRNVT
ncbi:cation-transporting P-type ATPase [Novilysobacter antarcticus]|uniref:cation-transporting P-type ATPase n=1 Tax=Novilysobacter antarcticus TaxID=2862543 RepID=UPI001C993A4B